MELKLKKCPHWKPDYPWPFKECGMRFHLCSILGLRSTTYMVFAAYRAFKTFMCFLDHVWTR
jgi:hypothetical protein